MKGPFTAFGLGSKSVKASLRDPESLKEAFTDRFGDRSAAPSKWEVAPGLWTLAEACAMMRP
ncbi:hypothetical protein CVV72_38185 [Amycolatopsis sp. TNS106]|nr:hypothetical protein CVV72_38185 [Amycolatopsis sp. TNS106]